MFSIHTKLHRSKTSRPRLLSRIRFSIHTKLHRSKTRFCLPARQGGLVSIRNYIALKLVIPFTMATVGLVSIRNYIALKPRYVVKEFQPRLVSIRNYIALKLILAIRRLKISLVSIRNYIALKRARVVAPKEGSLVSIRNYIALKPQIEARASGSLFPAIPYGPSSKNLVRKIFVDNYLFLGIQLLLSVCALHHDQTYAMAQRIAIYGLER